MGENTFELSVGSFVQSAYRFRVGFTTESCNMSEDQQGRSFDEYNIVFYRKCSSNSTVTSTTTSIPSKLTSASSN